MKEMHLYHFYSSMGNETDRIGNDFDNCTKFEVIFA